MPEDAVRLDLRLRSDPDAGIRAAARRAMARANPRVNLEALIIFHRLNPCWRRPFSEMAEQTVGYTRCHGQYITFFSYLFDLTGRPSWTGGRYTVDSAPRPSSLF